MSLLYTSMNSVLYITINNHDIPDASNIGKMIQQFSIGLGVVITISGFELLSSYHIEYISKNTAYSIVCYFLAMLMTLNVIIAIPFRIYHPKMFGFKTT